MSEKLRPYYDRDTFDAGYSVIFKPGVGLIDTDTHRPLTSSLTTSLAQQTAKKSFKSANGIGISGFGSGVASNASDKNYVYDLELQEYFDSNNVAELFKNLLWSFVKNYCKVILSQPLEIVRLVLQVGYFQNLDRADAKRTKDKTKKTLKKKVPYRRLQSESVTGNSEGYSTNDDIEVSYEEDSNEEEEIINYFQSTSSTSQLKQSQLGQAASKIGASSRTRSDVSQYKIHPISKHTVDIMSAIVAKDGPFALFRGINASFIYQTLSHTIEAWITGFMSPFLGIPDPFFLELTHSTDPWKSLWLSVGACVLTGLILMPLDLIKIRLMITQFNKPSAIEQTSQSDSSNAASNIAASSSTTESNSPANSDEEVLVDQVSSTAAATINTRSIRESIRNYPLSLLVSPPSTIAGLTILHQFSTTIFRKAAPYILFIKFNVDSFSSPTVYTLVNFLSLLMEFFVKLPVENLLRKEQVRFLIQPKSVLEDEMKVVTIANPDTDLIVEFNDGWRGDEDSETGDLQSATVSDNEQDLEKPVATVGLVERVKRLGLFDGWRVGLLNVVGFWGYNIIKSNGIDLQEERL